jgi:hypothetical protein
MNVKRLLTCTIVIGLSIACCMLPRSYQGSIEQKGQEGIIFFDNGVEDLILKVSPVINGEAKLDKFCWLVTVPNEPDKYDVIDNSIFATMFSLEQKVLVKPKPKSSIGCSETKSADGTKSAEAKDAYIGVELGKHVSVGDYDIQPIRGVGKHALSGLNSWLDANGFPTEPLEHMKYFVDNKFTFLCIKVNLLNAQNGMSGQSDLKPLHMTFKSEEIYYPMKYSSQQGDFSVNLYTLTTMPVDYSLSSSTLSRIDWDNKDLYKNVNIAKKPLDSHLKKALGKLKDGPYLYFNNFYCSQPNYKNAIDKWDKDVFLQLNASHYPNSANRMKHQGIDWMRTILLVLAISVLLLIAKRKWSRPKVKNT